MWFKQVTATGANYNGEGFREKADDRGFSLTIKNFQDSGGWVLGSKDQQLVECLPMVYLPAQKSIVVEATVLQS